MTTEIKQCIVHNRKYSSKFNENLNKIRRTNEFNISILQKLPKRCCSCHGQNGEFEWNFENLYKICQEINDCQSKPVVNSNPIKPIHYLKLELASTLTPIQCIYKAGRFVGRRGQNIKVIEQQLNVSIHIIDQKSNKNFRDIINKLNEENNETSKDGLCLLINLKDNNQNIEQIKQSILNQWNKIDVINRKRSRIIVHSHTSLTSPSAYPSKDDRWKPKKQNPRDKIKSKQKYSIQQIEDEVPPQSFVQPISMPKEITRIEKVKRRQVIKK